MKINVTKYFLQQIMKIYDIHWWCDPAKSLNMKISFKSFWLENFLIYSASFLSALWGKLQVSMGVSAILHIYMYVVIEGNLEVLPQWFKMVSLNTRIFSLMFLTPMLTCGLCVHVILSVQQAVFDATLTKFYLFSLLTLVSFFEGMIRNY